jgi:hypothetical protein
MTRRFRNRFSPRHDDDAALDALLAGTWEDGATAIARVLDLEAGKAALLAALGRQEPPGPGTGQGSVREQIDALLATVTAETRSNGGAAHSAITANLYAARQFLIQLRAGLAGRTLAKDSALDLAAGLDHALEEACRTLRRLPPGPGGAGDQETEDLAELIGGIRQQLPALSRKIEQLFDEAGDPAPPVPVPTR